MNMPVNNIPSDKHLDNLWQIAIILRDRCCMYSKIVLSELRNRDLVGHHITKKGSYRLRWNLENGICLTSWIHEKVAHGHYLEARKMQAWATSLLTKKQKEKIFQAKWQLGNVDKIEVKDYLTRKIRAFAVSDLDFAMSVCEKKGFKL